jgi:hypothetical protein
MVIDSGSHLKSDNVQNDRYYNRYYDRYTFEKLNMHTFCNFENPQNSVTLFFVPNPQIRSLEHNFFYFLIKKTNF